MNVLGTGTMICARNAGVDFSKPHIATKWMTLFYFRLWPLGTYELQQVEQSGAGIPLVGGVLQSKFMILKVLPWTNNKVHIISSLIVGWLFCGFVVLLPLMAWIAAKLK